MLLVLCTLSVVLFWHGARRVEPLRKEAETLANAQSQLGELMAEHEKLQAAVSVSGPGATEQARRGIIGALERLSPRVDASLDQLAQAQADSQELTKVVTSGIGLLLLAFALLARIAWRKVYRPLGELSALMRGLVRHDPEQIEQVDLAPLVSSIVTLVSYQMPDNVTLGAEMPPTRPARVPRNGFRQALLNLLRNAQRAVIGRGGLVEVRS